MSDTPHAEDYFDHVAALKRQGRDQRGSPMPWCNRCQCYHHTTAECITPAPYMSGHQVQNRFNPD